MIGHHPHDRGRPLRYLDLADYYGNGCLLLTGDPVLVFIVGALPELHGVIVLKPAIFEIEVKSMAQVSIFHHLKSCGKGWS